MTVPRISPIEKPLPPLLLVLTLLVEEIGEGADGVAGGLEERNVVLVLVRVWPAWVKRLQD
jgi:hypothetical protein